MGQTPIKPMETWLPTVFEAMQQCDSVAGTRKRTGSDARRGVDSFTRLLSDALVEFACEEVKAGPRMLGWCRPGFGEPPLSRFRAQQAAEGKNATAQRTWK